MKETETAVQQSDQNVFFSLANFLKQHEKIVSGVMTAVLMALLMAVVQTGLQDLFGYNLALTILCFALPGALIGPMVFGSTLKEIAAGLISGAVSAIAALAVFALLVTVNLFFFEIEYVVLISALATWGNLMAISYRIYRKYENYFLPFLLFVAIPSVWTIFFFR